jgi:putative ABC transport system substrate-binding protein
MKIKRRDFITLLGGAAAWPVATRAQQASMPLVGFLDFGAPEPSAHLVAAFRKGLAEAGQVESRTVAIEYRWAEYNSARLSEFAADLVRRHPAVLVAPGSLPAALAMKAATDTIPIVFGTGADPVAAGLVTSINRPGGNVTGVGAMNAELGAKRLGLLRELAPAAVRFAVLINPANPLSDPFVADVRAGAATVGKEVEVFTARNSHEIDTAFASLMQRRPDALVVGPDTLFRDRGIQLVVLAARHVLPAIYPVREIADAGGLVSYGSSFTDLYRQVGIYTGRVLKGEKPAEMPILQASKFELVVNLQTAKTLGIDVPPTLLAVADEVIE